MIHELGSASGRIAQSDLPSVQGRKQGERRPCDIQWLSDWKGDR
jgi:hypothetical protein